MIPQSDPVRSTQQQLAARQSLAKELSRFSGDTTDWSIFISRYRYTSESYGYMDGESMLRLQRGQRSKQCAVAWCYLRQYRRLSRLSDCDMHQHEIVHRKGVDYLRNDPRRVRRNGRCRGVCAEKPRITWKGQRGLFPRKSRQLRLLPLRLPLRHPLLHPMVHLFSPM